MRWKFVENRTIGLTGNVGLALPSNIGELGDSVKSIDIDLSDHSLGGELHFVCPVLRFTPNDCFLHRTGELPLSVGRLKATKTRNNVEIAGCRVNLKGNKGFNLSADITDVLHDTKLDFRNCYIQGASVRVVCPVLHFTSNVHDRLLCVIAQRRKKRRRPSRRSSRAAEYIFKGAYAYSTELCMSSATSSAEPSTLAWYIASSPRTGHTHEPQSPNDGRPGVGRAVC